MQKEAMDATQLARAVVAQLVKSGVSTFVLCPGSRSAPFAYALEAAERAGVVELVVETDERVAGFETLGGGLAGRISAVVTTSGSAVANLHPAVEEAHHAGVPMIVLAADRPADLRGVRASQTTDHRAVLAGSVRSVVEIEAGEISPVSVAGRVRRAVRTARGIGAVANPGPVLVNVGLRPPLTPSADWETALADCTAETSEIVAKRTVVVAGPSTRQDLAAIDFPDVPVLAEPSSPLRAVPQSITAHPILLETPLREQIERAVVVGHPTLTREVAQLLADPAVEVVVLDEPPAYTDISGNATAVVEDICPYLTADAGWYTNWKHAAAAADAALAAQTFRTARIEQIAAQLDPAIPTLLGASSIIRAVNLYAPCPGGAFYANRGLAGIDGNVSTALGIARARREAVRVVVGDLTFVHDVGALIRTAGQSAVGIDVVVLDDRGGSLFASLEYGQSAHSGPYDRIFRTEKEFDLERYCQAVGADYLPYAGDLPVPQSGKVRVIHVDLSRVSAETVRAERAAFRADIRAQVCASLG